MKTEFIAISVESRKGGVGKTTTALNIAKILHKRHPVLLIDIDITGTNILDSLDSVFWKDIVNPVKLEGKSINLLSLFYKNYLSGEKLPIWGEDKDKLEKGLEIDINRINIIGSHIYSDSTSEGKYTINPSILFDELHSLFLIKCLQEICDTYSDYVARIDNTERIPIIIFDNSPGYIGISPEIKSWLTSIGPERGKFIFVSSFDQQDIISCAYAMEEVHLEYKSKYNTAVIFHNCMQRNNPINLEKGNNDRFFFEISEHHFLKNHPLISFYNSENIETKGKSYLENSLKYLGVIINRIPKQLMGRLDYSKMFKPLDINNLKVFKEILFEKEHINQKLIIPYDKQIELQFFTSLFHNQGDIFTPDIITQKDKQITSLKERIGFLPSIELYVCFHEGKEDEGEIKRLKALYNSYFEISKDIFRVAENLNLRIESKISIEYTVYNLQQIFHNILLSRYKIARDNYYNLRKETRESRQKEILRHINNSLKKINHLLLNNQKHEYFLKLYNSILLLIGFVELESWEYDGIEEHIVAQFILAIYVQLEHWKKKKKISFQKFLTDEKIEREEYENYRRKFGLNNKVEYKYYKLFYSELSKAQARILQISKDLEFLIYSIESMFRYQVTTNSNLIDIEKINKILGSVIITKKVTYNSSYAKV